MNLFDSIEQDDVIMACEYLNDDMNSNEQTEGYMEEQDQDQYDLLPDFEQYDIGDNDDYEPEYTSNPEEFVPEAPIVDDSLKTEVLPWNVEMIAQNPEYNTYRGAGVKVAVIDSGIDVHNDLNTAGWVDFSDSTNGYKPIDNSGHGTEMAGVINGRIDGFGIIGIAPEAKVYSVKVLGENNSASISSIVKAIEWCIENKMDIVNMRFGMNRYSAKYDNVIAVGAIDRSGQVADFSARGEGLKLVAPGVDAQTTGYVDSYAISTGTSIAAAHVTGIAAVLKGIDSTKTNNDIKYLLQTTAYKPDMEEYSYNYGYGIPSLQNAIDNMNSTDPNTNVINAVTTYPSTEEFTESNGYVSGSWCAKTWQSVDTTTGTGHYAMINKLADDYFKINRETTGDNAIQASEVLVHRRLMAKGSYATDMLDFMSTEANGNRNDNGQVDATRSNYCISPYHAKTDFYKTKYNSTTKKNEYSSSDYSNSLALAKNHVKFLYELSRRRLMLGSNFAINSANYNGNTYYGVSISQITKRGRNRNKRT